MQMNPRLILYSVVLVIGGLLLSSRALGEGYARVCVTTVDADLETVFSEASLANEGRKLTVHLDANIECAALVVALEQKGSRLANGWRPQVISLPEWTEKILPVPPLSWEWGKAGDPFELWVFFFKHDAAGLKEIQKLVTAMQKSEPNSQLLDQQTRKICEMLRSRMSGNARIIQGAKASAPLVGGTTRRVDFPWRNFAQKVPLNEALEGELVVRHGR